jgi:hypothetical protein
MFFSLPTFFLYFHILPFLFLTQRRPQQILSELASAAFMQAAPEQGGNATHLLAPLDFVLVFPATMASGLATTFCCCRCGSRLVGWKSARKHACVTAALVQSQTKLSACQPAGLTQGTGQGFFHPPISSTDAAFMLALCVGWAERPYSAVAPLFQCSACGFTGTKRSMQAHSVTSAVTSPLPTHTLARLLVYIYIYI